MPLRLMRVAGARSAGGAAADYVRGAASASVRAASQVSRLPDNLRKENDESNGNPSNSDLGTSWGAWTPGGAQPDVVWQWEHRTGFKDYLGPASERIEHVYQLGRPYARLKSGKKGTMPMEVFFVDMIQYDPASGNRRNVRRVGPEGWWQFVNRRVRQLLFSIQTNRSIRPLTFEKYAMQRREELQLDSGPSADEEAYGHLKRTGLCSAVVRSGWFFAIQIIVITINSVWIGIDYDSNLDPNQETGTLFIVAEHFFCIFFSAELAVRFGAYAKKRYCLSDSWFLFDGALLFLMVMETWVLPLAYRLATGNQGQNGVRQLSVLRMLRLLRLTRLTRLLKVFPQLMTLLKGMVYAMHSVFYTLVLLLILLYIFGVIFATQSPSADTQEVKDLFPSVYESMWRLLLDGTFLDGTGPTMIALRQGSFMLTTLFLAYIFMSSFTVLNMLIGILCEVVTQVTHEEKEQATVEEMRQVLMELLECYDKDDDKSINRDEFDLLMQNPEMHAILQRFNVDADDLLALKGYLFHHKRGTHVGGDDVNAYATLSFADFLDMAFRLRGGNTASVRDIVELRDYVTRCFMHMDGFHKPEVARPGAFSANSSASQLSLSEARDGGAADAPVAPEVESRPDSPHLEPATLADGKAANSTMDTRRSTASLSPGLSPDFEREVLAQLARLAEGQQELRSEVRSMQNQIQVLRAEGSAHDIPGVAVVTGA